MQMSNKLPEFFSELIKSSLITEADIEKTDDGFFAVKKCISEILAKKNIKTFPSENGEAFECNKFFDDWYFYAIYEKGKFTYSLFKLREQEYDMYAGEKADADTPGVTVCFISFSTEMLLNCLKNATEQNILSLTNEINRVVAKRGQKHNSVIRKYFSKASSEGAYLIAELYVEHILSFTHKGFIILPQRYEELYVLSRSSNKKRRLPDFIDENNKLAGYVVCDHEKVYIKDAENTDIYQKYAILATHTADTSFNSFAAEVRFHALFLFSFLRFRIPFVGSLYESAIRADLSIADSEFERGAPYHKRNSLLVKKQKRYHGDI